MTGWRLIGVGVFLGIGVTRAAYGDDLALKAATLDHPHIRAILEGRIKPPGCSLHLTTATADNLGQSLEGLKPYDLLEVDIVPFLKKQSAGGYSDYVLIPVFLTRGFQLRNIYIRTDRGINSPADLRGKSVGVSERSLSASVWVRGIFNSSWSIKPGEMIVKDFPDAVSALQQGQLDAAFSTRPPPSLNDKNTRIARLFEDYYPVESELFRSNRVFPIGSALAIRKKIVAENPWVCEAIFKAFSESKKKAIAEKIFPLPWEGRPLKETEDLMGKNFWSYGVKSNPKTLGALFKYLHEQKQLQRPLKINEVFEASTLMLIED